MAALNVKLSLPKGLEWVTVTTRSAAALSLKSIFMLGVPGKVVAGVSSGSRLILLVGGLETLILVRLKGESSRVHHLCEKLEKKGERGC